MVLSEISLEEMLAARKSRQKKIPFPVQNNNSKLIKIYRESYGRGFSADAR